MSMLLPRLAIESSTLLLTLCRWKPRPALTATPMMMPSMVRMEHLCSQKFVQSDHVIFPRSAVHSLYTTSIDAARFVARDESIAHEAGNTQAAFLARA